MRLQRVRHDLATKNKKCKIISLKEETTASIYLSSLLFLELAVIIARK